MKTTKHGWFFLLSFTVLTSMSAKNVMIQTDKLLVEDPLTAETWESHWKPLVGTWKWEGNSIKGIEILEQNHHAGA
ncbi:MAG: hypothetical protein KJT03_03890, partial [Verrucomicrobiae bacterium]|nr:hypothetical protein [Verrucomicrobiae bacterium]